MVSPARRREAAREMQTTHEVSERRACKVIGQPRRTQRCAPRVVADETSPVKRKQELVRRHPLYGYRRIWVLLRREKEFHTCERAIGTPKWRQPLVCPPSIRCFDD